MNIFISLILFVFGACVASFLNATAYRIDKGFKKKELLLNPSSCENCNRKLTWIDLLPIIGFILSKGKCSGCSSKINIIYPITELFLAISFVLLYQFSSPIYFYLILSSLVFLAYFDIESMSIPKGFTDVISIVFVLLSFILVPFDLKTLGLLLTVFLALLLLNMYKKSFGLGDLIVFIYTAIYFNITYILHYLFFIVILGAIYSVILIILKRISIKDYIPLLPFITLAYIITVLLKLNSIDLMENFVDWIAQSLVL